MIRATTVSLIVVVLTLVIIADNNNNDSNKIDKSNNVFMYIHGHTHNILYNSKYCDCHPYILLSCYICPESLHAWSMALSPQVFRVAERCVPSPRPVVLEIPRVFCAPYCS